MATVTSAGTLLAVIQNPIITAITNPDNLKPGVLQGSRAFFSQRQVLDKVPTALLVYAAMTLGLQTVGYLLLSPPPEKFSHSIDNEANQNSLKCGDKSNATCGKVASSQNSDPQVSEQNHKSYGSYNTNGNKDQSSVDRTLSCIAVGMANKEPDCCRQDKYKAPSVKPLQALQTPIFYSVVTFCVATLYSLTLKSNYYNQFALLYIRDDRYLTLTLVGTLIPVVAVVSRLCFGAALDKKVTTIKDVMVLALSVNGILCSFWYFVPNVSPGLYMVIILCLAMVHSTYYVILRAVCLQNFGLTHFSTNITLLQLICVLVGLLVTPFLENLGWSWL